MNPEDEYRRRTPRFTHFTRRQEAPMICNKLHSQVLRICAQNAEGLLTPLEYITFLETVTAEARAKMETGLQRD